MNKKAFTLIELLAVIIILGILMLVAIPSVTNYINNSRKEAYITSARNIIKGAINLVNSGELDVYDPTVTYYISKKCINLETGGESPYGGDFNPAYVLITYDNNSFYYYWMSTDNNGMGIKKPTASNDLTAKHVEAGVKSSDITPTIGIDGRETIIEFEDDCVTQKAPTSAEDIVEGQEGVANNSYYIYTQTGYVQFGYKVKKENGEYLFASSNSDDYYENGIFRTNPDEAMNDAIYYKNPEEHFKFYLRIKVDNDVVTGADIGYKYNNNYYYLAGSKPSEYERNKSTLYNSFGSNHCYESYYSSYDANNIESHIDQVDCTIDSTSTTPGYMTNITAIGNIDMFDEPLGYWGCMVYDVRAYCTQP